MQRIGGPGKSMPALVALHLQQGSDSGPWRTRTRGINASVRRERYCERTILPAGVSPRPGKEVHRITNGKDDAEAEIKIPLAYSRKL